MKTSITKIIAVIVCSIIFAPIICAQEKPTGLGTGADQSDLRMIDAFGYVNSGQIRGRLDTLLKMLSENPAAKGFIINYAGRADQKFLETRRTQINEQFALRPKDLTARVTVIDGGYRENVETELWISTDGKRQPAPTIDSSVSSKIEEKLKLIAADGRVYNEQLLMHLDELLRELKSDPAKQAYIINYGSIKGGRRDLAKRKRKIVQYFSLIKADTSRVTLIDGGNRKEETTEIWISPDDKRKPVPTPTVDVKPVETKSAAKKSARRKLK